MARRRLRSTGLLLAGVGLGLLLILVGGYVYFRSAADSQLAERLRQEIDLPQSAFELERLEGDSLAQVTLHDVAILGDAGDTIVAAPSVSLRIHLGSISADGPIILSQVVLNDPYLNLVQDQDGTLNLMNAVRLTAGGNDVATPEAGAGFMLRDVRIEDGRVRFATPWVPDSLPIDPEKGAQIRLAREDGVLMRVRGARDVNARLSTVRIGGQAGWRVDVSALAAQLTDPGVQVLALRGSASEAPDGASFTIDEFRTERSTITGNGVVSFADPDLQYSVNLSASPVDFADLEWLVPSVPAGGQVSGEFAFESRAGGRIEIRGNAVAVSASDSHITGHFAALAGGGEPALFWNTRISLEPLRLETLTALGIGPDLPYTGEIEGVVASAGDTAAVGVALQVSLAATFAPPDSDVAPSTIRFQGPVSLGGGGALAHFNGVRVSLEPLQMAALRPLAPDQAARLRGTVNGTLLLNGNSNELRVPEGDITYEVGNAPASHLTNLTLQLGFDPELHFDLGVSAEPLALGTFAELFPAMPFRSAAFTGPLTVSGNADEIEVTADLTGSPGHFALQGTLNPGTPFRFDVSGQVSALQAQEVITRPVPIEGPVTGTFAAAGSVDDFQFNVALAQDTGSFALQGHVSRPATGMVVQVAGDVTDFNLGSLIGRPQLFPSHMTGQLELTGGGQQPYLFNTNLTGPGGALAVQGGYNNTGPIPTYSVSGSVTGIDLQQLPGAQMLPRTSLTGTINLQGQGTTLEALAGQLQLNATGSTVADVPMSTLRADLVVRDGVLTVNEFAAVLEGAQLTASGTLGLTRPVSEPLAYRLVSSDLSRLVPLLPQTAEGVRSQLSGSLVAQGWVSGSLQNPEIATGFRGQNLRYNDWQAALLQFDTQLTMAGGLDSISGTLALSSREVHLTDDISLDSLRLALSGQAGRLAVRVAASRPGGSSVMLAGLVELEGRTPRAITMDSLLLRSDGVAWQLANPAEVRWGGVDGVRVTNLLLQRLGSQTGSVLVNGTIPPSGDAAFQVTARDLDLDIIHGLLPSSPAMAGLVNLDALLQGPVTDPQLTVRASARDLQFEGVQADSLIIAARYDQQRMASSLAAWRSGVQIASGTASIPMHLALENTIPRIDLLREDSVDARIMADSLPLALLTVASPTLEDVAGSASAEVTVSGSIDHPQMNGWATLNDGAVTIPALGVHYDRISGRLTLDNQLVRVDSLRVWSDGNALVNGTIRVADLNRPELYLTANLDGFRAIENTDIAQLTLSGNLALSGIFPEPVLTGRLVLDQGVIFIPSLNNRAPLDLTAMDVGEIATDTTVASGVGPPSLLSQVQIQNLNVVVDEGVWLQSEDARVEIQGELVVFRSGEMPRIYGTLQAVRGTYALTIGPLVREFDVSAGSVRFFGTPDFNPDLDITAEHEVRVAGPSSASSTLTILVHVTGTLEYPRVALTSNTRPPLPESELLNYLIFGQPTFQLAAQRVGGLAQQILVQELVGGILLQELGHLGLPCQYFRLRGRPDLVSTLSVNPVSAFSSTSVECGVQLANSLFLTLETGPIFGGSNFLFGSLVSLSLDWQINDHMTTRLAREPVQAGARAMILTPVEVPYQWSVDLRGTWEFGKPRNEAPLEPTAPEEELTE